LFKSIAEFVNLTWVKFTRRGLDMPAPTSVPSSDAAHYDKLTIVFHWLTAFLVVALFVSAEVWGFLQKGGALRRDLQSLHVSVGIALAAIVVLRVIWRFTGKRQLPPSNLPGWQETASSFVHVLLYFLIAAQIALGFLWRWAQGEPFTFFGVFSIPAVAIDPGLRPLLGDLHSAVAWVIIGSAGLHALAALMHHYVLRDDILYRMMPGQR
jgi:cytochrome b561